MKNPLLHRRGAIDLGTHRTRSTLTSVGAALAAVSLVLAGCGGQRERTPTGGEAAADGDTCTAMPGSLSIATGNSTGVYYVLGGGLASVISENSDLAATAAETGASVQNLQQLAAGDYGLAFSLADTAADAVNGDGEFDGPQDLSALARIYDNYTHVVVRKDAGIESVADFAGKTVSTGSPKSGTEVIAQRLIEAAGLDQSEVNAQRIDLSSSTDAMKDGSIDAMVWSGGLPTAGITDLFTNAGNQVEILDISDLEPAMKEINPVYEVAEIPADTYTGQAAVNTIATPNVLMVRNDMDNGTACALTTMLFEHHDDLVTVHAAAEDIVVENATPPEPITLHPGAQQAIETLQG